MNALNKEKLLLHHCCAPCTPIIYDVLSQEYDIESYWFNPNIQPDEEYEKRKKAFDVYALHKGLRVHYGYDLPKDLWRQKGQNKKIERCQLCYRLRIVGTAKKAKQLGMSYFSTTLLISPQQNHELIRNIGYEVAQAEGLKFVYKDIRFLYNEGKYVIKNLGLYSQKYCGCMPSLIEKEKEHKVKSKK